MKKLICICLSFLICLGALICGNICGNNITADKACAIQDNAPNVASPNATARQQKSGEAIVDGANKKNVEKDENAKATSGEFADELMQDETSNAATTNSDAPVYNFEMHAWGRIWRVENDSQDIDPEFSYFGADTGRIMPIQNKTNEQSTTKEQTTKEQYNNLTKNITDKQQNNSLLTLTDNQDKTETQNKIMPRAKTAPKQVQPQQPSVYPTNPNAPRHNGSLNNGSTQIAMPNIQKPSRPAPRVEDNQLTTPEGNKIKNNAPAQDFNKKNSNKIAAPYGSKTNASVGAANVRADKFPKAIFVKKLFKAVTRHQEAQNDQSNKIESAKTEESDNNNKEDLQKTAAILGGDNASKSTANNAKQPMLAIVIDDFGGWERTGVKTLLDSPVDITCAIIPLADNSEADYNAAINAKKEVILHMPMEAHVNLPKEWYGTIYIANNDTPETAIEKLEKCLATMPEAKGFNFHIGSGVNKNLPLMKALYHYALQHNMFFLDSRTVVDGVGEKACSQEGGIYLGRDVFLEPQKNRSYQGVYNRLEEGMQVATQKGVAVVIGHVGAEGGENTAKCIADHAEELAQKYGVKIVPISQIYSAITNKV